MQLKFSYLYLYGILLNGKCIVIIIGSTRMSVLYFSMFNMFRFLSVFSIFVFSMSVLPMSLSSNFVFYLPAFSKFVFFMSVSPMSVICEKRGGGVSA